MTDANNEQRATRRFALKLPITVKPDPATGDQPAQTEDVSARGVYFYLDSAPTEGSLIDFTLTLPAEITLTEGIRVRCVGRVVRVDSNAAGGQVGIAAAIEQYDFLGD